MNASNQRILILGGAGAMGAGIVRDLLSAQSDSNNLLVVADLLRDRVDEIVAGRIGNFAAEYQVQKRLGHQNFQS